MKNYNAQSDQTTPETTPHSVPQTNAAAADSCHPSFGRLHRQLRGAGVLLIVCDGDGNPDSATVALAEKHGDWHTEFFCQSTMFRSALQRSMRDWREPAEKGEPEPVQALPGVWLVPPPMGSRRRHVELFPVAVVVTRRAMDSEHFHGLCQSADCDGMLARSLFKQLPPVSEDDEHRLITLVGHMQANAAQLAADEQAIEGTGRQLAESYEEISLLYTITQSMTVVQQPDRFVSIACEELLNTLPYSWIGAVLADDPVRLKALAGRFITTGEAPTGPAAELAQDILSDAVAETPIILQPATKQEDKRFAVLGTTVLVHPVASDGRVVGLLLAGEKQGPDTEVSSVDIKLLDATATHLAIFLENAALYDDLNAMFLGTLEALTASIDAKDRYTCGHSQRVALLTQQLAKASGMDDAVIKRMRIAGLVHDVGKIGVPERVLLKPGKLDDEEFAWIRRHPEMGHRILKDIPQLQDLLPGVLHHHERWDGRGYPSALAGEDIPLVARLIALADSFDAMSSTRTYRSAMNRTRVLKEIEDCAGTQFDPRLARHFLKLDFSEYDRLVAEHQATDEAASHAGDRSPSNPRRAA